MTDKTIDQLEVVAPTEESRLPLWTYPGPLGQVSMNALRQHLLGAYTEDIEEAVEAAIEGAAAGAAAHAVTQVQAAIDAQIANATQVVRDAVGLIRVFGTIAAAMAVVADGEEFCVPSPSGSGAFRYQRSGTGYVFKGAQFYGARGASHLSALTAARSIAPYPTRGLVTALWGINGRAWDGRVIPNEAAPEGNGPTLNILANPLAQAKENAATTPTVTYNYATVPDPTGGQNAQLLNFSVQREPLTLYRMFYGTLPAGDYRVAASLRTEAGVGSKAIRLGATNTAGAYGVNTVVDTQWTDFVYTNTAYPNTYDLSITSDTGVTGPVLVYAPGIYDAAAGAVLPTPAQQKAGQYGHAKRPFAFSGSIKFGPGSSIDNTVPSEGMIITLPGCPTPKTFSQITLSIWLNVTGLPTTTAGNGICVDFSPTTEFNTSNSTVQIGVTAGTGNPYIWPGLGTLVANLGFPMVGKGWRHLTVTVKDGEQVYYLDGVPCLRTSNAFTPFQARAFRMLGYNSTSVARHITQLLPCYADGAFIYDVALTGAEVRALDLHGRLRLRINGTHPARRSMLLIGGCDSITAFSNSWAWQGSKDATFNGAMPFICEAVGGSNLANWVAREAFMMEAIDGAKAAGYMPVVTLLAGANEYARWRADGSINPWLADFLAYAGRIRARGAKVVIGYMLPRADGGASVAEAELYRQQLLSYWDTNWSKYFDARIQFGRDAIMGQMTTSQAAMPATGGDYTWFLAGGTHPTDAGHMRLWQIAKPVLQALHDSVTGIV